MEKMRRSYGTSPEEDEENHENRAPTYHSFQPPTDDLEQDEPLLSVPPRTIFPSNIPDKRIKSKHMRLLVITGLSLVVVLLFMYGNAEEDTERPVQHFLTTLYSNFQESKDGTKSEAESTDIDAVSNALVASSEDAKAASNAAQAAIGYINEAYDSMDKNDTSGALDAVAEASEAAKVVEEEAADAVIAAGEVRDATEDVVIEIQKNVASSKDYPCFCEEEWMCDPVQTVNDREIFGFGHQYYEYYDWDKVTTIAWAQDDTMTCKAHSKGVRVLMKLSEDVPLTQNVTARMEWVHRNLDLAKQRKMDGIVFDVETPMEKDSPEAAYYVQIVNETTQAFHEEIPGSMVTVCLPWSPKNVDGRNYQNKALSKASDLVYIMGYDTRSQIWGECIAGANSALPLIEQGIMDYLRVEGLEANKVIMGVPWYGYTYQCLNGLEDLDTKFCNIKDVPFHGANCSDAAGSEISYGKAMGLINDMLNTTQLTWDPIGESNYFNYVTGEGNIELNQLWYDDAKSLGMKYDLAKSLRLRGVGPFTFDQVDYLANYSPLGPSQAKAMWSAFDVFLLENVTAPGKH